VLDGVFFFFQLAPAVRRNAVDLPALVLLALGQALVFEELQRRINRACAGAIKSAGPRFELLDDLIAMLRPVVEQRQDGEPYLA
jgi:hypothetical protein